VATFDARPSAFTQLATTGDWEALLSMAAVVSGGAAIDASVGSAMVPSLDTPGRNAVLADGNALIKGQLWRCDASVSVPIPAASAQNRIDRLVLRLTRGAATAATVIVPTVVTGTPSGSPVIPPLVQTTSGIWDYPVSHWTATSAGALTTLVDDRRLTNDSWHDMRPLTNNFIGSITTPVHAPPQYRFADDCKFVEIAGYIQTPSTTGNYNNVSFATLPAAYRPSDPAGVDWFASSVADSAATPVIRAHSDGTMTMHYSSATLAQTIIGIYGRYPLQDQNGFLLS
jgi:hypothetical protein